MPQQRGDEKGIDGLGGGRGMNVKRYEWVSCDEHACHCDVVESAEGDLVDYDDYAALEARCAALAAELSSVLTDRAVILEDLDNTCFEIGMQRGEKTEAYPTPVVANHDAFLAEVRAQAHKEGAHFVANRMLAAWDAGFIDDTAKNAADIARMILTSTEFMADAPEGDFDRCFADGVLEDIAVQLRKEAAQ